MKARNALIAIGIVVATGCDPDGMGEPQAPSATLRISSASSVSLSGSTAGFSPQDIDILGPDPGGELIPALPIEFPQIPLAFGQSQTITQVDVPAGEFDTLTGMVTLPVALHVTDTDGDAAPMVLMLTTATATGRNATGNVVSILGSPRDPASGTLKLVGLGQIPEGFDNGSEGTLLAVEILASLEFDPTS